ncbi:MAG: DUF1289 domain-containing protein [Dehalococcoidia bacterium]|nr:DUF1289 domain-containing protein [Dehalococcoidia bacterium]
MVITKLVLELEMITSPCIGICIIDPVTGYCRGCHRTLKEISEWRDYDDEQARELLLQLDERDPDASEFEG